MPAIGAVFRKGREWVAWMGLVPHEHSTVGKLSLLDISQRGELVSATTVRTRRRRSLQYREKQPFCHLMVRLQAWQETVSQVSGERVRRIPS